MTSRLERRVAAIERRMVAHLEIMEILVRGGLVPGVALIASFSGREWEVAPDESFEAFRARAKAAAEAEGVRFIIFGGLPNVSWMPTDSEIQADAGATRGLNSPTSAA
jgi:hypothetical protein